MTLPWLAGTAVALFTFITTVLNVPLLVAGYWQLAQAVRRWREPDVPANSAAGTTTELPWRLSPAPSVIVLPGEYYGGAVPTSSVMNLSGYVDAINNSKVGISTYTPDSLPFATAGTTLTR